MFASGCGGKRLLMLFHVGRWSFGGPGILIGEKMFALKADRAQKKICETANARHNQDVVSGVTIVPDQSQ